MSLVVSEVVTNFVSNLDGLFNQLDGLVKKLDDMSTRVFKVRFEADNAGMNRTLQNIDNNIKSIATVGQNVQKLLVGAISAVSERAQSAAGLTRNALVRATAETQQAATDTARVIDVTLVDAVENFASTATKSFLAVTSVFTFFAFTLIPDFVNIMTSSAEGLVQVIQRIIQTLPGKILAVSTALFAGFKVVGTKATLIAGGVVAGIVALWQTGLAEILGVTEATGLAVQGALTAALTAVTTEVGNFFTFLGGGIAFVASKLGEGLTPVLNGLAFAAQNFATNVMEALGVLVTFGSNAQGVTGILGQLAASLGAIGQLALALVGFNVITGFIINRIRGFLSGVRPNTVLGKAAVLINIIFNGLVAIASPATLIVNRFAAGVALITTVSSLVLGLAAGLGQVQLVVFGIFGLFSTIRPLIQNFFIGVSVRLLQVRAALGDGQAQFALLLRGVREAFSFVGRFVRQLARLPKTFNILRAIRDAFAVVQSIATTLITIADQIGQIVTGVEKVSVRGGRLAVQAKALNDQLAATSSHVQRTKKEFDEVESVIQKGVFGVIKTVEVATRALPNAVLNTLQAAFGVLAKFTSPVWQPFRTGAIEVAKWFGRTFGKEAQGPLRTAWKGISGVFRTGAALFGDPRQFASRIKEIWRPDQAKAMTKEVTQHNRLQRNSLLAAREQLAAAQKELEVLRAKKPELVKANEEAQKAHDLAQARLKAAEKLSDRQDKAFEAAKREAQHARETLRRRESETSKLQKAELAAEEKLRIQRRKIANDQEFSTLALLDINKKARQTTVDQQTDAQKRLAIEKQLLQTTQRRHAQGLVAQAQVDKHQQRVLQQEDALRRLKLQEQRINQNIAFIRKANFAGTTTAERKAAEAQARLRRSEALQVQKDFEAEVRGAQRVTREHQQLIAELQKKRQAAVDLVVQERHAAEWRKLELDAAKRVAASKATALQQSSDLLKLKRVEVDEEQKAINRAIQQRETLYANQVGRQREVHRENMEALRKEAKTQAGRFTAEQIAARLKQVQQREEASRRASEAAKEKALLATTKEQREEAFRRALVNRAKQERANKEEIQFLKLIQRAQREGDRFRLQVSDQQADKAIAAANRAADAGVVAVRRVGGEISTLSPMLEAQLKTFLGSRPVQDILGSKGGGRTPLLAARLLGDPADLVKALTARVEIFNSFFGTKLPTLQSTVVTGLKRIGKAAGEEGLIQNAELLVTLRKMLGTGPNSLRKALIEQLDATFSSMSEPLRKAVQRLDTGDNMAREMRKMFAKALHKMAEGASPSEVQELIARWFRNALKNIKGVSKDAKNQMAEVATEIVEAAAQFLRPGSDPKHPKGLRLGEWFTKNIAQAAKRLRSSGRVIAQMLGEGIGRHQQEMTQSFGTFLQKTIKDQLPQSPPLKGPLAGPFLETAGRKIVKLLSLGLLKEEGFLATIVGKVLRTAFWPLFGPTSFIIGGIQNIISAVGNLKQTFQSFANSGVLGAMKNQAEQVALVGRQARRVLGSDPEAVQEFDAFRRGMELLRVESTQTETAFTTLQRKIADAAGGSIEARAFFERYVGTFESIENGTLNVIDVFFKLQNAYQGVARGSKEAQEILDATGATMLELKTVFEGGSAAIVKAMAEAKRSGAILTEKDVQKAEEYEQAMRLITQTLNDISRTVLFAIMPQVLVGITRLRNLWNTFKDEILTGLEAVGEIVGVLLDIVAVKVGQWIEDPSRLFRDAQRLVVAFFRGIFIIFDEFLKALPIIIPTLGNIIQAVLPLVERGFNFVLFVLLPKLAAGFLRLGDTLVKALTGTAVGQALTDLSQGLAKIANQFKETFSDTRALQALRKQIKLFEADNTRLINNRNAALRKLQDTQSQLEGPTGGMHPAVKAKLLADREAAQAALKEANREIQNSLAALEGLRRSETEELKRLGLQDERAVVDLTSRQKSTFESMAETLEDGANKAAGEIGDGLEKAFIDSTNKVAAEVVKLTEAAGEALGKAAPRMAAELQAVAEDLGVAPQLGQIEAAIARIQEVILKAREKTGDLAGAEAEEYKKFLDMLKGLQAQAAAIRKVSESNLALAIENARKANEAAQAFRSSVDGFRQLQIQLADLKIAEGEEGDFISRLAGKPGSMTAKLEKVELETAQKLDNIEGQFADASLKIQETMFDISRRLGQATAEGNLVLASTLAGQLQTLKVTQEQFAATQSQIIEKTVEEAERAKKKIREEQFEGIAETVGSAFSEGLTSALTDAFNGKIVDFKKMIGGIFNSIRESLAKNFIESTVKSLQKSMTSMFSEVFKFAGDLAGDLANGVLFIVSSLLAQSEQEINAVKETVNSVVESTEAVRGVISGETTVALKEVADNLKEAMGPTNNILLQILRAVQGGRSTLSAELAGTSAI